jgi:hypothetical protein
MSSVDRNPRQVAPNALYIALAAGAASSIYDPSGLSTAGWVAGLPAGALLRDMGKTLYVPAATTPSAAGAQSTILKKVQLVSPNGFGTGGAASGVAGGEFNTGYIQIGGQTYGGGNGSQGAAAALFARAN